jgi:hypothetical protein
MSRPLFIPSASSRAAVAACCALLGAGSAIAQGCSADIPGAKKIESSEYVLAYRTTPAPIPMGRHFTVELVVCPRSGAAVPERVQIDAHMPEHRHGMNYKALVKPLGSGRFHAEGLMFHMPGRWQILFDVQNGGGTVRLADSIVLR